MHPEASFIDLNYDQFVRSAWAIEGAWKTLLEKPESPTIGQLVLAGAQATWQAVGTNTNLGMNLLLAPLVLAHERIRGEQGQSLRIELANVLQQTTVADAELVYEAIRLMQPGGMGQVAEGDVTQVPQITLLAAMKLAADRDWIARAYVTGYQDLFDKALPQLKAIWLALANPQSGAARSEFDGQSPPMPRWHHAVRWFQIWWLAEVPDTLIERKHGAELAAEVLRRAKQVLASGNYHSVQWEQAWRELDGWLREYPAGKINPGTTADMIAAMLFVAMHEGWLTLDEATGATIQ